MHDAVIHISGHCQCHVGSCHKTKKTVERCMRHTCPISRDFNVVDVVGKCRAAAACVLLPVVGSPSSLFVRSLMIPSPSVHPIRCKRLIVNPLPPAVSFVVAQPQQSRSLASAVDNLPHILRRTMPPDSSQPSVAPTTSENDDQSSTDDSTELPPVHSDHEFLGAASIMSLLRHDTQCIYYEQCTKIPHQSLLQTKFPLLSMPITPHPLLTLHAFHPLFRTTLFQPCPCLRNAHGSMCSPGRATRRYPSRK